MSCCWAWRKHCGHLRKSARPRTYPVFPLGDCNACDEKHLMRHVRAGAVCGLPAIETRLKPECERADVVGEQEVGSADKKPSAGSWRAANSSRAGLSTLCCIGFACLRAEMFVWFRIWSLVKSATAIGMAVAVMSSAADVRFCIGW